MYATKKKKADDLDHVFTVLTYELIVFTVCNNESWRPFAPWLQRIVRLNLVNMMRSQFS